MNEVVKQWMEVSKSDGVTIIRFKIISLIDLPMVQAIGDEWYWLAAQPGARLLVSFGPVQQISSTVIAKLIELQRRLSAKDGKLAICCEHQEVRDSFRITHTDRIVEVHSDEESALNRLKT
jgi:anti-anti-sigma factor